MHLQIHWGSRFESRKCHNRSCSEWTGSSARGERIHNAFDPRRDCWAWRRKRQTVETADDEEVVDVAENQGSALGRDTCLVDNSWPRIPLRNVRNVHQCK